MARDPRRLVGEAGWITAPELLTHVSRSTLRNWVAAGTLVRLRPGVLALPTAAQNWRTRVAAALHGREAVASHATDRLPVASAERAVVDAWATPGSRERSAVRAAAITGVRRRICSPPGLRFELTRNPVLRGHAELARLVDLLADGCRSELEIWGCLHVLRAPGMPTFVQQRRLRVGGETFVLDAACEESMLAVEMDGAAWHGSRAQREADIRRDALVATAGWQTVRRRMLRGSTGR